MNDSNQSKPPQATPDPKTTPQAPPLPKQTPADPVDKNDGGEALLSGHPREKDGVRDPQPKEIGQSDAPNGD